MIQGQSLMAQSAVMTAEDAVRNSNASKANDKGFLYFASEHSASAQASADSPAAAVGTQILGAIGDLIG
jgi:hypothetical protein